MMNGLKGDHVTQHWEQPRNHLSAKIPASGGEKLQSTYNSSCQKTEAANRSLCRPSRISQSDLAPKMAGR